MSAPCQTFQGYYTVYMHIFPNGWVYVGMTGMTPEGRWGRDGHGYAKNHPPVWDAIQYFGWDVIIGTYTDKREAKLKERELTRANVDHCYNKQNTSYNYPALYWFKKHNDYSEDI